MRRVLMLALGLLAGTAQAAELQPFARGSYIKLLAEGAGQKRIIHFWSVTCAPCLAEMPRWRSLAARRPDVRLVLVSTDSIEDAPGITARLKRFGLADTPGYAFADGFADALYFEVDRQWHGELPRSVLVAADGRTRTVVGTVEDSDLDGWFGTTP
jgi:hypothetical protein